MSVAVHRVVVYGDTTKVSGVKNAEVIAKQTLPAKVELPLQADSRERPATVNRPLTSPRLKPGLLAGVW